MLIHWIKQFLKNVLSSVFLVTALNESGQQGSLEFSACQGNLAGQCSRVLYKKLYNLLTTYKKYIK